MKIKSGFPELAGSDWLEAVHFAMHNFKDESFISQYLSPKIIRDFWAVLSTRRRPKKQFIEVSAIHDDPGYRPIEKSSGAQYNLKQP